MAKQPTKEKKSTKVRVTAYAFKDVDKFILAVRKDGESLKTKIHSVAVCIAKHWHDHPQAGQQCADKMTALVEASGYHRKALGKWVQEMLPMQWSKEENKFYVHKDDKLMGKVFMAARDTAFWTISPPPQVQPLNDIEELRKLVDRIMKRKDKGVEGDVIHPELWRGVTHLLSEAEANTAH